MTDPADSPLISPPISIDQITLVARDLGRMSAFYRDRIGLQVLDESPTAATLGVDRRPLIRLEADPAAAPDDPRSAGLFHLALLLPTRAALAVWLKHAAASGLGLDGASDHGVSEALYLQDPEGNGIEIYVDRAPEDWPRDAGGGLAMSTEALDLPDLLAAGRADLDPLAGARMGHVHLRVGDVAAARRFYGDGLGFAHTQDYPGAAFFGSGGYHHHVGANIWRSRGAGRRSGGQSGLARTVLRIRDQAAMTEIRHGLAGIGVEPRVIGADAEVEDPWGLTLELRLAAT